jgi:hypothetical protein
MNVPDNVKDVNLKIVQSCGIAMNVKDIVKDHVKFE